ncbi:MAG: recombinase family protein [Candidatus Gracilibacteria bacterium]|nr:recombinase family protein [Candidatus Gracilibacteria bacterium]
MSTNVTTDKNLSTNGKFYLYVRKSSESEDRQVQSIQDQKDYWMRRSVQEDFEIVGMYEDEKTAKMPNCRPGFKKMCKDVETAKIDGILCLKLDRLSRNPVDTGYIQYMLQQGKIERIITSGRVYFPDDAGLIFSVETGMANQYILDLTKNTKRGMLGKVHKGWLPGVAPRGYANDKMSRTITTDAHEFRVIKRLWEMVLDGESPGNAAKLISQAIGILGLGDTTRGISSANAYQIVRNPFYAGKILYKNEIFPGKHEPMVSWDDFQEVQKTLKKRVVR